jgi:hypothetical protein
MALVGEKRITRRIICPSTTWPNIILMQDDMGSNPGLCSERAAIKRLDHDTDIQRHFLPEICLNIQSVPRSKHTVSVMKSVRTAQ